MQTMLAAETTQWRRLILILSASGGIAKQDSIDIMVDDFLTAIQEKTAPIIVSSAIVLAYLYRKQGIMRRSLDPAILQNLNEAKKMVKEHNVFAATSFEAASQLIATSIHHPKDKSLPNIYQIDMFTEEYFAFVSMDQSLMLYIPRTYAQNILGTNPAKLSDHQLATLGFSNRATLQELPSKQSDIYAQAGAYAYLTNALHIPNPTESVALALSQLILPAAPDPQTGEYPYAWNIFAGGHGSETGDYLVGLSKKDFHALLLFLNNHIKTNIFYYSTCFGGGLELLETYRTIEKSMTNALNYILISGATTTASLLTTYHLVTSDNIIYFTSTSFTSFFTLIEQGASLDKALSTIYPESITAVPLIRFPNTEWFNITAMSHVTSLTKPIIYKYLIDNKGIMSVPRHVQTLIIPLSQPDLTQTIIPGTIDLKNRSLATLIPMPAISYIEHINTDFAFLFLSDYCEKVRKMRNYITLYIGTLTTTELAGNVLYQNESVRSDFRTNAGPFTLEKIRITNNPAGCVISIWYPKYKRYYVATVVNGDIVLDEHSEAIIDNTLFEKLKMQAQKIKTGAGALQKTLQQKLEQLQKGNPNVSSIPQHKSFLLTQPQSYRIAPYPLRTMLV